MNWLSNRVLWILSLVVNWLSNRMLWIARNSIKTKIGRTRAEYFNIRKLKFSNLAS